MLLSLTIKNFITAEYLDLDFSSGTTAITGETGSGKSLIFNALSILLGGRAETNMIRHDSTQAEISAYFDVQMIPSVEIWLQENGFSVDKECLLRRVFNNQGRSKGYINGGPATMTQLQKLGEILVDIHDQNEHQFLFQRDNHRILLDEYAKANDLLTEIKNIHAKWKTLKRTKILKNKGIGNYFFNMKPISRLLLQIIFVSFLFHYGIRLNGIEFNWFGNNYESS